MNMKVVVEPVKAHVSSMFQWYRGQQRVWMKCIKGALVELKLLCTLQNDADYGLESKVVLPMSSFGWYKSALVVIVNGKMK